MNGSSQLQILIQSQRRATRWYAVFASAVVVLGLALLAFAFSSASVSAETLRTVLGLAGGFISTISVFPVKEILACQDKIAVYGAFQAQLAAASEQDRERIETVVWDALKSIALKG